MEEVISKEGTMMMMVVVTLIAGDGRAVGHGNCRSASLFAGPPQLNRLLYDDPHIPLIRLHFLYLTLSNAYTFTTSTDSPK
jgi:hypothetical protein